MEDVNITGVKDILFRILVFIVIALMFLMVILINWEPITTNWTMITAFFSDTYQAFLHGINRLLVGIVEIIPLILFVIVIWAVSTIIGGGGGGDGDGGGDGGGE